LVADVLTAFFVDQPCYRGCSDLLVTKALREGVEERPCDGCPVTTICLPINVFTDS
jgi:hypothetical protein